MDRSANREDTPHIQFKRLTRRDLPRRLGEATRESSRIDQPRQAIGAGLDAQLQLAFSDCRNRHQVGAAPKLSHAIFGLLRADDNYADLGQPRLIAVGEPGDRSLGARLFSLRWWSGKAYPCP
jgi:hypothetical protein